MGKRKDIDQIERLFRMQFRDREGHVEPSNAFATSVMRAVRAGAEAGSEGDVESMWFLLRASIASAACACLILLAGLQQGLAPSSQLGELLLLDPGGTLMASVVMR